MDISETNFIKNLNNHIIRFHDNTWLLFLTKQRLKPQSPSVYYLGIEKLETIDEIKYIITEMIRDILLNKKLYYLDSGNSILSLKKITNQDATDYKKIFDEKNNPLNYSVIVEEAKQEQPMSIILADFLSTAKISAADKKDPKNNLKKIDGYLITILEKDIIIGKEFITKRNLMKMLSTHDISHNQLASKNGTLSAIMNILTNASVEYAHQIK